ncbi:TonB-linked outer membrane protein, SusC/RagA family [Pedobacter suwonensis]|uniref:TonB-linked outer membrane protein, SusC/RagA family n=1 Tax=Pedobacter suwonensis TaxID=332999 RepID=A0A1I0TV89_9SPHI|nr:TonB-dependent receptor [Pedobacter suwonensis]SFA55735.1 TonB-linked outer membrane protein, SusC/RagA family [Pedobacter suwonensis]
MRKIYKKKAQISGCLFFRGGVFRTLLSMLLFLSMGFAASAQNEVTVKGVVKDTMGGLPMVNIKISGTTRGISTDEVGRYTIKVPRSGKLLFSLIGYKAQLKAVSDYQKSADGTYTINVILTPDANSLEDVAVVGFGTQKKESVVSSITTINPKELKGPTSNLTTMLAGRVAGMIAFQRSGEPGADNANFFIRGLGSFGAGKQDPLILVDGAEVNQTDLARLQPDDISTFSVLKDAAASAVYGARGANGVLLITTKLGKSGETQFTFRAENSVSGNTQNFKFADNITYMRLANEGALTRNRLAQLPYQRAKIDATAAGENPLLYPNNNWIDELIKDYTLNQRFNMNITGGGVKAVYYISGTYNIDNGVLKVADLNNFNSNIKLKNYSVRSNVTMNFTNSLTADIKVYGQFDDYTGPVGGGSTAFNRALWSNPVMFPAVYPASFQPYTKHPLFGGALAPDGSLYMNPYAEMVKGYQDKNSSTLQTQIELKQDLRSITPGLNLRLMSYARRYASFDIARYYNPFYYSATEQPDGSAVLTVLNGGGAGSRGLLGQEYLNYTEGRKDVNSIFYAELAANYSRTFKKHDVSAMVIGTMRNYLAGNSGSLQLSLPARNQGVSGRATYGYDSKYLAEFNFGYNGSERFAEFNRFGFFPSFGLGYVISNEKFFKPLTNVITTLKLRGTYGFAGNDQIGQAGDRFFYLSEVSMADGRFGAAFGEDGLYYRPGVSFIRYPNNLITWERSESTNLALEMTLFKDLNMTFEVYKQTRSSILTSRSFIPSTMGLQAQIRANTNKYQSQGIDFNTNYNKSLGNSMFVQLRGNFTYATGKILTADEPTYAANESYRYLTGQPTNQTYGLIAERLFVDDNEAKNSPKQFDGIPGINYGGGDIKYRDVNGDGIISEADRVPIGLPTTPEIIYGFGGTFGFKGFDFSVFLQGSARSSFFIDPGNISPFVINHEDPNMAYRSPNATQNGLLKAIADSHWSEQNRDSYAFWPRLSDRFVNNNLQTSTWWMRNGAFLRIKSVELGYNLPNKLQKRLGLKTTRLYLNANNLTAISAFKLWDPEMGGKGLGYPIQVVYNIGVNVSF